MKQLLKAILPVPVLNAARDMRDRGGIYSIQKQTFEPSSLRAASSLSLSTLFADPATAAAWHDDHDAIRALFGDSDRPGSDNPGDRRALYHLIGFFKSRSVLEVGTFIGGSTLYIARALKRIGTGGKLTTVDILDVNNAAGPWKDAGLAMPPIEMARRLDCIDAVDFVTSPSLEFMEKTDKRFDLVFLDGDIAAHSVYRNVAAALKVLQPDGVILLHAYYPRAKPLFPDGLVLGGPYYAMARITRENPGIETLPLGNLPWPTKQGSHATSLALVVRTPQR